MSEFIIGVIGKDLFNQRLHIQDEDFANVLYEQLIFVLKSLGTEVSEGMCDYRLGVYLDTQNEGYSRYKFNKDDYWDIREKFGHFFYSELEAYSKREQKKGTEVLFQLNNGDLTMEQFNKKLK